MDLPKVKQVEIEGTVELSDVLLESNGDPICQEAYNSRNRISVTGAGALPSGVAAGGDLAVTGYSAGVTKISATEEEQETGGYHRYMVEALNCPHAVEPS